MATCLKSWRGFIQRNGLHVDKGRGEITVRAFVLIDVQQALPLISPSYDSGATEDEIHQEWTQYFTALISKRS